MVKPINSTTRQYIIIGILVCAALDPEYDITAAARTLVDILKQEEKQDIINLFKDNPDDHILDEVITEIYGEENEEAKIQG